MAVISITYLQFYIAFFLLPCLVQGAKVIRVENNGTDEDECLQGNGTVACRSLDFVFGNRGKHFLSNDTRILIGAGRFDLYGDSLFQYKDNISLEGSGPNSLITCVCEGQNIGIQFIRSSQISFRNLGITNCRTAHTSTTITHPKLYSGLFFAYCKHVSFVNVSIFNNTGIGVTMFDVGGVVEFTNVSMRFNMDRTTSFVPIMKMRQSLLFNYTKIKKGFQSVHMDSGGGVYVEFTSCGALDPFNCSHVEEQRRYNANSTYLFKGCDFSFNVAEHKLGLRNDVKLNEQSAFGRGGGFTFLFKGSAQDNNITVDNCSFIGNLASWGAGYYIAVMDLAQRNKIHVKRAFVAYNFAAMAGGGGRFVSLYPHSSPQLDANDLYHTDCRFVGNRAIWGGGFSLTGTTRVSPYIADFNARATFLTNTEFYDNLATVGSAIGLNTKNMNNNTIGPGLSFVLLMKNCKFVRNSIVRSEDNRVIGEGAMYSEEVTLVFKGNNTFFDNNSTALVLDSSSVSVFGRLLFEANRGIQGGAMSLFGTSWIMLNRGCELTFLSNTASSKGGAIYVKSPGPERLAFDTTELETGDCFFKYADNIGGEFNPNDWEVSVNFINNTAPTASGNSVYASTLQHCRIIHEGRNNSTALQWKPFQYTKCGNRQPEVVTNAVNIQFDPSEWKQPPGLFFSPKMVSLDEKNNSVFGTIKVRVHSLHTKNPLRSLSDLDRYPDEHEDNVKLYPPSALFLVKDKIQRVQIQGREGAKFSYQFVTTAGQIIQTDVFNSTLNHCPIGYTQDKGETTCECMSTTKKQRGVLRCSGLSIYLQPGYWGSVDSEGQFFALTCPDHYCTCCQKWSNTTAHKCDETPEVISECQFSDENQCRPGRVGPLCSLCKEGMSVKLGSEKCEVCGNIWLLLLIPMGLVGLLFVLVIMYFDINAFSGYLNAFLYCYQIVTLLIADCVQLDRFIGIVIGATSLSGTGNSQVGVCLYNGFDNLQKLGFNYVLPVYLLFCTFCIGVFLPDTLWRKLYRRWNVHGDDGRRTSFGHAMSFIAVLCYSAFTSATLNIMHWVMLDGRAVVFQAAYVDFLGNEHLPYFIIAVIVLLVIVLGYPTILIFTPFFTARFRLILRLEPSLTALQNCFQDGQRGGADKRPFAAFYFICRLLILSIGVFMQEETGRLVLITLTCVITQSIFVWFQPYKRWTMNFFDNLLLTNLSLIGVLSILLTMPNYLPTGTRKAVVMIVKMLVYLPLITVIIRGFIVLYQRRQWKTERSMTNESQTDGVTLSEPSTIFNALGAPLISSSAQGRRKEAKNKVPPRVLENVAQGHA